MAKTNAGVNDVTRILVVDDHPIVRKGLVDLFDEQAGLTVCGQAATMAEALAAATTTSPQVAVVDLTLGAESGLDLLAQLSVLHPAIHVLVLSAHDERLYAERALKAGALGYVMKDQAASDLVTAVRRVAMGKTYVSPETAERILSTMGTSRRNTGEPTSPLERLSDRERHVFDLLGQGLAPREIAASLRLSVKTVESHVAHLKEKLGAENGRELARLAVSWSGALAPATAWPSSRRSRPD